MMLLISVAITTAYVYSAAVVLGLTGEMFFWELVTLIDVMLVGHWIEGPPLTLYYGTGFRIVTREEMLAMTIGQVAAGARVNIQTVRYYERRGLLLRAPRTASGYRQYYPYAVARLRFIKRAQDLGFSLEEIAELLELRVEHGAACAAVEAKAKEKIPRVEKKIGELERMKTVLIEPTSDCPVLETLSEDT